MCMCVIYMRRALNKKNSFFPPTLCSSLASQPQPHEQHFYDRPFFLVHFSLAFAPLSSSLHHVCHYRAPSQVEIRLARLSDTYACRKAWVTPTGRNIFTCLVQRQTCILYIEYNAAALHIHIYVCAGVRTCLHPSNNNIRQREAGRQRARQQAVSAWCVEVQPMRHATSRRVASLGSGKANQTLAALPFQFIYWQSHKSNEEGKKKKRKRKRQVTDSSTFLCHIAK